MISLQGEVKKEQSCLQEKDLQIQESKKRADAAKALLENKQKEFEDKLKEERENTMKAEVITSIACRPIYCQCLLPVFTHIHFTIIVYIMSFCNLRWLFWN